MAILQAWLGDPLIQSLILAVTLLSGSITGYYAHAPCDKKNSWLGYFRYFIGSVFSGIGALFIAHSFEWPEKMTFLLYAYGCYTGPYMAKQLENLVIERIMKTTQWRSKDK